MRRGQPLRHEPLVLYAFSVDGLRQDSVSRRRGGQDFLVLGVVLGLAQLGRDDEQVVVHLALGEGLADLGQELAFLEVARPGSSAA